MSAPSRLVTADVLEEPSSFAVVEQATGALMLLYGVDPGAAHALLREWSDASGYEPALVAEALLHGVSPSAYGDQPDGLVLWLTEQLRCARPAAPGLPGGA